MSFDFNIAQVEKILKLNFITSFTVLLIPFLYLLIGNWVCMLVNTPDHQKIDSPSLENVLDLISSLALRESLFHDDNAWTSIVVYRKNF